MQQKYIRGDYVKIADDYSTGFAVENGVSTPILNDHAGCEGIVMASYGDQYGTPGTGGDYTVHVKGFGKVSWFSEGVLTLIERGRNDKLKEWEAAAEADRKEKSDIDWIFSHGKDVLDKPHGASIATLARCFGLTDLWGSHGEGVVYYQNAMATLALAEQYLKSGDKDGWLTRCEELKAKLH